MLGANRYGKGEVRLVKVVRTPGRHELRDLTVTDSRAGVRVERGAAGVTAAGVTLSGGQDGVVAGPGTTRVVLQDLRVNGVADDAVRSSSPDELQELINRGAGVNVPTTAAVAGKRS